MSNAVTLTKPGEGGAFGKFFCSVRHPSGSDDWCRRLPEHKGKHSAFVHSIATPEEW
jgi:hypothetical protein